MAVTCLETSRKALNFSLNCIKLRNDLLIELCSNCCRPAIMPCSVPRFYFVRVKLGLPSLRISFGIGLLLNCCRGLFFPSAGSKYDILHKLNLLKCLYYNTSPILYSTSDKTLLDDETEKEDFVRKKHWQEL